MHAADKPALILGEETLTHGQFQVLKDQVVAALQRDGIAPGDVIAICAATSLAYVVTFMGCVQCGVVVAPLAPSSSAQDLAAMLANAQAKCLFTDAETLPRLPAPHTSLFHWFASPTNAGMAGSFAPRNLAAIDPIDG